MVVSGILGTYISLGRLYTYNAYIGLTLYIAVALQG
jgi:hypothetical protein